MKFIITGSLGNISRPLAVSLVKDGHDVTVISSKKENEAAIKAVGAKAAIGSIEDEAFLIKTFTGADAIYTMVPPNFTVSDYRAYYTELGKIYAKAIKAAKVTRVVNLSSIGADLPSGQVLLPDCMM
ncbi:MAG: NAD(P)H-binding protein [Chitinophagaceae bacterium]